MASASSSTTNLPALRWERTQEYLASTTSTIGSLSSFFSVSFPLHSPDFSLCWGLLGPKVDDRDNHGTRVDVEVPQVEARVGVDDGGAVRVEERLGVVGGVRALAVVVAAGLVVGVVGLEGVKIVKIGLCWIGIGVCEPSSPSSFPLAALGS